MMGQIEFEKFEGITTMPQKAASAWTAVENLVGVKYKPLVYVGSQQVNGVNYWFIAECELVCARPARHLVLLAVNENGGDYTLAAETIEVIL